MSDKSHSELLEEEFLKLRGDISSLFEEVDTTKNSYLQNYFFQICHPLFSFAESVIFLCKQGKVHCAGVLLRTLYEAHINLAYIQGKDSHPRLALLAKSGFDGKLKGLRELKMLIEKYPNLESHDPTNLFSREWLSEAESWAVSCRTAILRNNNINENEKEPSLKDKAILCDSEAGENIEKGYYQRMYSVIYRQLSPPAHLNVEGIQFFVDEDKETGKYSFNDGDEASKHLYIAQAIEICLAYSKDLYDSSFIQGKRIKTITSLEVLLGLRT